jgi:hypothetical protein
MPNTTGTPTYRISIYRKADGLLLRSLRLQERADVWWDLDVQGPWPKPLHDASFGEKGSYHIESVDISHEHAVGQVSETRYREYPTLGEFADAFVKAWQGDPEPMNAYVAACAAVKAKHPKPPKPEEPPPVPPGPGGGGGDAKPVKPPGAKRKPRAPKAAAATRARSRTSIPTRVKGQKR